MNGFVAKCKMIGNKYGKVFIIALINIVAIFFVYNNVSTDTSKIVLGQDSELDTNSKDTTNTFKHTTQTKESDKKSDSDTTIGYIKQEKQETSNHDVVKSMKNLLSIKIKALKVNKSTTLTYQTVQDEELHKMLLDSSEIDLSPPNPVILSSSIKIADQVRINLTVIRSKSNIEYV
jgi:membrane-associated HD superfamily phosphohydrolase